MQRGAINEVPMANPFGTPLDPTSVYTLAASFIVSCPASNAPLPFVPFPRLAYKSTGCTCEEPNCSPPHLQKRGYPSPTKSYEHSTMATKTWGHPKPTSSSLSDTCPPPMAGATVMFTAAKTIPAGSFLTFVNGLSVVSVAGNVSGKSISAAIPSVAMGQTYVFVTSSDQEATLSDTAVLFGPAIVEVYPPAPSINYSVLK